MSSKISNVSKSWVTVPENSDFPIQNLPFGIYKTATKTPRVGVALGTKVIDLKAIFDAGHFSNLPFKSTDFENSYLNDMMAHGKKACSQLRLRIFELFELSNETLKTAAQDILDELSQVTMLMPVKVGDYTDFYSSREHATNVGIMFRDPENALLPNWLHIPVGYHGRASSIIESGKAIHRPKGQTKPVDSEPPVFGPSKQLDFELEMAFVTFNGKDLGDGISTKEADDYIFGMCICNDWSARDIQKWEYVPLGPFLAKNFATSISPWIVTLEALEQFRIPGPIQAPEVLPYLKYEGNKHIDINLEVTIAPEGGTEQSVSKSNYKHMYWNMNQQLAHHTVNGCNINCGDMLASGTISGPNPENYGSMLELAWKGTKPIQMNDGTERKFLLDGDTVGMQAHCKNDEIRVGFGKVLTKILPAK